MDHNHTYQIILHKAHRYLKPVKFKKELKLILNQFTAEKTASNILFYGAFRFPKKSNILKLFSIR